MKITKYKQSCFLIESRGSRILVDPGSIDITDDLVDNHWTKINAILVTHKHSDHMHVDAIRKICTRDVAQLYTGAEVLRENKDKLFGNAVKIGERFFINGIEVRVTEARHGWNPNLRGKEVENSFGFMILAEAKVVYIVGDSICFDNTYKCDILCVPVSGAGLVMGTHDAALYAQMTEAKTVIPCHYDNPTYPVDINKLNEDFTKHELKFYILSNGETLEV